LNLTLRNFYNQKKNIDVKINDLSSKIKKIDDENRRLKRIEDEIKLEDIKKSFNYTNKMIKIAVVISGTDHESGYCSTTDGYELEEQESFLMM
jgi:tellurite resistance protein